LIAVLAFATWFLLARRRKRRANNPYELSPNDEQAGTPGLEKYAHIAELQPDVYRAELMGDTREPVELDGRGKRRIA